MIGLKRNTVKVVDYDPDWAMLALEYCRVVRNACGELLVDVQHVGSTAVPELPPKPILEIAAALATIDSTPEIVRRLTCIGYFDRGDQGDAGGAPTYPNGPSALWHTAADNGENTFTSVIHCGKARDAEKICRPETRPCEHLPG
ncbi:MAG: GrpB family protein [Acidobacteriota bacterium]|nr:GrpB family protein [Acidobacteriota bacterium]